MLVQSVKYLLPAISNNRFALTNTLSLYPNRTYLRQSWMINMGPRALSPRRDGPTTADRLPRSNCRRSRRSISSTRARAHPDRIVPCLGFCSNRGLYRLRCRTRAERRSVRPARIVAWFASRRSRLSGSLSSTTACSTRRTRETRKPAAPARTNRSNASNAGRVIDIARPT